MITLLASLALTGQYVHLGRAEIDYLNIAQSGTQISGYIEGVTENLKEGAGWSSNKASFAGKTGGSSFDIQFGGMFSAGADCTGSATHEGIKLLIPQKDGRIQTDSFKRASAETWNEDLKTFKSKCFDARIVQQWQIALQSYWPRIEQEQNRVQSDLQTLPPKDGQAKAAAAAQQARLEGANDALALARSKVGQAKQVVAEWKRKVTEDEEACKQDPSEANQNKLNKDSYTESQAEYAESQAEYNVSTANYNITSVTYDLNQATEAEQSLAKQIAIDQAEQSRFESGTKALKGADAQVAAKFKAGTLWTAYAAEQAPVRSWLNDESPVLFSVQLNQSLSVVPVTRDWWMVLLNSPTVGWIRASSVRGPKSRQTKS